MRRGEPRGFGVKTPQHAVLCFESRGFTLVELVIATVIASLVMGIVAVALGFSLRIWERRQNQAPSDMPAVIELLKWQLATFEPQPVRIDRAR